MLLCSKPQTASLTVLTARTATTAVVFVFLRLTLNVRAETHINRRPLRSWSKIHGPASYFLAGVAASPIVGIGSSVNQTAHNTAVRRGFLSVSWLQRGMKVLRDVYLQY